MHDASAEPSIAGSRLLYRNQDLAALEDAASASVAALLPSVRVLEEIAGDFFKKALPNFSRADVVLNLLCWYATCSFDDVVLVDVVTQTFDRR